jgi:hypothetical protein
MQRELHACMHEYKYHGRTQFAYVHFFIAFCTCKRVRVYTEIEPFSLFVYRKYRDMAVISELLCMAGFEKAG